MEDPHPRHLWFEAIGGLTIIAVIALGFLIAIVKAEKSTSPRRDAPAVHVTGKNQIFGLVASDRDGKLQAKFVSAVGVPHDTSWQTIATALRQDGSS
jgi:hypothetical protein